MSPGVLGDVQAQVRAINAVAEVRCTERSSVDLAWVLDTRCFSAELALAVDSRLTPGRSSPALAADGGEGVDHLALPSEKDREVAGTASVGGREELAAHNHAGDGEHCVECSEASTEGPGGTACSVHDPLVTTCAVDLPGSLDLPRLERWLGGLLWDPPPGGVEVYRVKGVVSVEGRDERFVVQGVADLFEVAPAGVIGSAWREVEARRCKVVFIGRLLSKEDLEQGVRSCMVQD